MADSVTTEGVFSGLALWLVPTSSAFNGAVREEMAALRRANAGNCSGEFGVHATLVAGLGGRDVDGQRLRDVTVQAVEQWRNRYDGLTVRLKDVTTKGSYFQITQMHHRGVYKPLPDGIAFKGFTDVHFDRIDVYDCTGKPEHWVKLHSIPL